MINICSSRETLSHKAHAEYESRNDGSLVTTLMSEKFTILRKLLLVISQLELRAWNETYTTMMMILNLCRKFECLFIVDLF